MAMKLKDGLFIGDGDTSQSEDFINDNKISNLINLSGKELPNLWAAHGLVYMTFNWEDRPDYKLGLNCYNRSSSSTSQSSDFITDMVDFIDVSIMHGISVLLFSRRGVGRCAVAACVYFMVKYRWGFEKAFEFIYSKKPDIALNAGFVQQLYSFDKYLLLQAARPEHVQMLNSKNFTEKGFAQDPAACINLIASTVLSKQDYMRWKDWEPSYLSTAGVDGATYDQDEMILLNGYSNSKVTINSLPGPFKSMLTAPPKQMKLKFNSEIECDDDVTEPIPFPSKYTQPARGVLKYVKRSMARARVTETHQDPMEYPTRQTTARSEHDVTDNLYNYVGLGSLASKLEEPSSQSYLSAEDRLRNLVAGLIRPTKELNLESSLKESFDPIAAYEKLQRSGAIRGSHDISQQHHASLSSTTARKKTAWGDTLDERGSSASRRSNTVIANEMNSKATKSAPPVTTSEPPRQYRYGSPAPRSQQRKTSTTSSTATRTSSNPPEPTFGARQPSPSRFSEFSRSNRLETTNVSRAPPPPSTTSVDSTPTLRRKSSNSSLTTVSSMESIPVAPPQFQRQSSRGNLEDPNNSGLRRSPSPSVPRSKMTAGTTSYISRSNTPTRNVWRF